MARTAASSNSVHPSSLVSLSQKSSKDNHRYKESFVHRYEHAILTKPFGFADKATKTDSQCSDQAQGAPGSQIGSRFPLFFVEDVMLINI